MNARIRCAARVTIGLAAAALVLPSASADAVSNPPGSGGADYGNSLSKGDTLYADSYIWQIEAYNGHYMKLVMQSDGNLVEYASDDDSGTLPWRVCWASGTYGSGADHATYQQDGNFVVYTPDNTPVWASNTQWKPGSTVNINPFGKVYVGTTPLTDVCV
ncbi:hypothetical protein ACH47Z_36025 [Streptomyces sp. NPDC020192]|uniref:hypothetical protein n=1 Tax=Streptomyces sp. NPDC020192 TaxID=3365066 RepID=UPI00379948FE